MVCYSSKSPLPSLSSILCFAYAPFCFNALLFSFSSQQLSCSYSLLPFMICAASACSLLHHRSPLPVMHCISSYSHESLLEKKHSLFSVLHHFHTPNPLPNHHSNSSSSLVVMQNRFIINGCYPDILCLL